MQVKELIAKKRDGEKLSEKEIQFLLQGYLNKEIPEYQMAAFLMAIFFKGLQESELSTFLKTMWQSGRSLEKKSKNEIWCDKHSTGGVGDKTSLILVPLILAVSEKILGKGKVKLPMISGRGLGHTGGTLDKLESVPGFQTRITIEKAMGLLEKNGFFMMGQTDEIAPLDRLLYSLRDVTATVECLPLIVSSILSKKLSESLDILVFDVKVGEGAFMKNQKEAKVLAKSLIQNAKKFQVKAVAVITRMEEPLGWNVGNFLEMEECEAFFSGKREKGLEEVTVELASSLLTLIVGKKLTPSQAKKYCLEELQNGSVARSYFTEMLKAQGGDIEKYHKEKAIFRSRYQMGSFKASKSGYITQINAKTLGTLLIEMGGGRKVKEAAIDPYVGFEIVRKTGEKVQKGDEIVKFYCQNGFNVEVIMQGLITAIQIGKAKKMRRSMILEKIV